MHLNMYNIFDRQSSYTFQNQFFRIITFLEHLIVAGNARKHVLRSVILEDTDCLNLTTFVLWKSSVYMYIDYRNNVFNRTQ